MNLDELVSAWKRQHSVLALFASIQYTKFCLDHIFIQSQPLFVFLQSETGSNNKRDKNHVKIEVTRGIMVSEIDKYIVSFFFDDKGLKLSLLN